MLTFHLNISTINFCSDFERGRPLVFVENNQQRVIFYIHRNFIPAFSSTIANSPNTLLQGIFPCQENIVFSNLPCIIPMSRFNQGRQKWCEISHQRHKVVFARHIRSATFAVNGQLYEKKSWETRFKSPLSPRMPGQLSKVVGGDTH